jgi:hypothetical protein
MIVFGRRRRFLLTALKGIHSILLPLPVSRLFNPFSLSLKRRRRSGKKSGNDD